MLRMYILIIKQDVFFESFDIQCMHSSSYIDRAALRKFSEIPRQARSELQSAITCWDVGLAAAARREAHLAAICLELDAQKTVSSFLPTASFIWSEVL